MPKRPHRYTKKLQFDTPTRQRIYDRDDGTCIFCRMGYQTDGATGLSLDIRDIMHFVPKSQMGLGIEENSAVGCRYHHMLLDNGSRGLRQEMLMKFGEYLKSIYPGWDREKLVYKKYDL